MKNSEIALSIALIGLIVYVMIKKREKSFSNLEEDSDKKPKRKKCWRTNAAGNGQEWYYCTKSKM